MKQSSIEYIAEKHDKLVRWMEGDAKADPYSFTDFDADLKIARKMHRQEIEEAYGHGFNSGILATEKTQVKNAEQYYTETFTPTHNQG